MTLIDRFIGYMTSTSIGRQRRAIYEWMQLTEEERHQLGQELIDRGYSIPSYKNKNKKPSPKIEYDEHDRALLARKVWEIRKNSPTLSFTSLITKAQDSLPREKHRKLINKNHFKWLARMLTENDAALEAARYKPITVPSQPIMSRDEILNSITNHELTTLIPKVLSIVDLDDLLHRYSTDQILDAIKSPAIISWLVSQAIMAWSDAQIQTNVSIRSLMQTVLENASKHEGSQKSEVVPSRIKIMIVGLLPDQQNVVYRAIGNAAKLTFLDKNQNSNIYTAHQNIVVVMADFISHSVQNQIKSKISNGTQLITHHGGISKLIERLTAILAT